MAKILESAPGAAAAVAAFLGPGLVDHDHLALKVEDAAQSVNGLASLGLAGHFHEPEPPGLVGGAVKDHRGRLHLAERLKGLEQVFLGHFLSQATYK